MPIPQPKPQEEKKDFIMRCMSDPKMNEEYTNKMQRLAICSNTYEKLLHSNIQSSTKQKKS